MNDILWDHQLNIRTVGREALHSDEHHYPYEATPYSVLLRLAQSGYLRRDSKVIDYGCGKGRVSFFLNHVLDCQVTGIEYHEPLYREAEQNLENAGNVPGIEFVCVSAEEFPVEDADCFYFFNPFSVEILERVMERIIESGYQYPRAMSLFFYYPSDEYLAYLMTEEQLMFLDEIPCQDLFDRKDERERIMIFELDMSMWNP